MEFENPPGQLLAGGETIGTGREEALGRVSLGLTV